MKKNNDGNRKESKSEEIYNNATEECRNIIRFVLSEERNYMHLKKRSDVYEKIYSYVKKVVK